jgi:phage terminase small subunit
MARQSKSASAVALDNNPGKRSQQPAMKALPGAPPRPTDLSIVALEEWDRVVELLDAEGRLTVHDGGILRRHCIIYDRLERISAELGESDLLVPGRTTAGALPIGLSEKASVQEAFEFGRASAATVIRSDVGLVKNPGLQVERNYQDMYLKSCVALGINPGSRDGAPARSLLEDTEGLLD